MPTAPRQPAPALAELYVQHKDAVFNAAFHLLGDRAAAEDVLQDVFVALVRLGAPALHSPRAWLLTAALNRVRDRARRPRQPADADAEGLPGQDPGPEQLAAAGEAQVLVAAALQRLPLQQREVVVLHAFEGLSFAAIGELAGTSADTAASRWRYGCAKLRARLQPLADGPGGPLEPQIAEQRRSLEGRQVVEGERGQQRQGERR